MDDLLAATCKPCEGGVQPLTRAQFAPYLGQVKGWTVDGDARLIREFRFKDFAQALAFVNAVGAAAETEGHHPDILLHGWNKVTITLYTHAIGGLSLNDFIVAAKIDAIPAEAT